MCDKETVHSAEIGPKIWAKPQPKGVLPRWVKPGRSHRLHAQVWMARQERLYLSLSLFRQKATSAVDQPPARAQKRAGFVKHLSLKGDQIREIKARLGDGQVGMAADCTRCGTRGIEQNRIKRRRGIGQRVGDDQIGV